MNGPLSRWIEHHGEIKDITWRPNSFATLADVIIQQQLSVKVASTIKARVAEKVGGELTADSVLSAAHDDLREAGLSRSKTDTIQDIAQRVHQKDIVFSQFAKMDDDGIRQRLTAIKGVGTWTAYNYMMFALGRPNLWPAADVGLQAGLQRLHQMDERPSLKETESHGGQWSPWRTVAALYVWKINDAPAT